MDIFRYALICWSALQVETGRAERRVLKSITHPPKYRCGGELVSVIIPAYNEEGYLPSLLTALVNQTYRDIEVIVVDNASTDRTADVARNAGAVVLSNPIPGVSLTRNMGASIAKGNILVFIDADSVPESTLIEKTVKAMEKGAILVYPNKCCTNNHWASIMRVGGGWSAIPPTGFCGAYMAIRRAAFEEVGGFDESLIKGEDTEFILDVFNVFGDEDVRYLRSAYVGTSMRRQEEQGWVLTEEDYKTAVRRF